MTLALKGGKKITSIDFNTMAPAAASADMYPLDDKDQVQGRKNFFGWLAVGVPGTLAGLQLALERYGTRSFREVVQPAIEAAENGVVITELLQRAIRSSLPRFRNDPGSFKLYLKDGQPLPVGERLRNPDLANLLRTLAERNSVDSFYRGDIAQRLADEFKKNGGMVTAKDFAFDGRRFDSFAGVISAQANELGSHEGSAHERSCPAGSDAIGMERSAHTIRRSGKSESAGRAASLDELHSRIGVKSGGGN